MIMNMLTIEKKEHEICWKDKTFFIKNESISKNPIYPQRKCKYLRRNKITIPKFYEG